MGCGGKAISLLALTTIVLQEHTYRSGRLPVTVVSHLDVGPGMIFFCLPLIGRVSGRCGKVCWFVAGRIDGRQLA